MVIHTSYFARVKQWQKAGKDLSKVALVSICLYSPKGWPGYEYRKLAPPEDILSDYKRKYIDHREYRRRYSEYLNTLDRNAVIDELRELTDKQDVILLCYEKSGDFCHRHLAKKWLEGNLDS